MSKILSLAYFREVVRLRAAGLSRAEISRRVHINLKGVMRVLDSEEGKAHLAKLQDDMDAELVRSMVYCPWVDLVAGVRHRNTYKRRQLTD